MAATSQRVVVCCCERGGYLSAAVTLPAWLGGAAGAAGVVTPPGTPAPPWEDVRCRSSQPMCPMWVKLVGAEMIFDLRSSELPGGGEECKAGPGGSGRTGRQTGTGPGATGTASQTYIASNTMLARIANY